MTNPKLIYKAEKPYTEDLNDLVEVDIQKGGPGSGSKGHQTHHYEPAKLPGYKFSHSEHVDNAPTPNVIHHYESEGSGNKKQDSSEHHEQLHNQAQKHHGYLKHDNGMVSHKVMGTQVGQNQKTGKNNLSITLKKK